MTELTPQEIADALMQFREDAVALDNALADLVKKHPGQWAGMFMGKLHIAPTLDALLKHFDDAGRVAVKYLDPHPKQFIFAASRNDTGEDQLEQQRIRSGALRSLSILEKSFIRRASGRYVVLSGGLK